MLPRSVSPRHQAQRQRQLLLHGHQQWPIEHTFRFLKQVLGWTAPKIRDPAAADRWTWLLIAACTQLRLAAALAADLRLPWQRPAPPGQMTPARVRRGFRAVRDTLATPAAPRNPPGPAPDAPEDPRTGTRHPATTSANATPNAGNEQNADPRPSRQVKWQVIVHQNFRGTRIFQVFLRMHASRNACATRLT